MKKEIILKELQLKDLQPSQFYISKDKIEAILKWFKPHDLSNFNPIPIKLLNGKLVMTDGHTRAVVAIMHGLDKVPIVLESDDLSWDMYEKCVEECIKRDIKSPYDLLNQIVNKATYHEKWDKWCDNMQKEFEK